MAVAISNVTGTLSHGSVLTISGSGFGSKATAAPVVWDDCSGTTITDKWAGAWPDTSIGGSATYAMGYRAPGSVSGGAGHALVHTRSSSKYMCGCAAASSNYTQWNTMVWAAYTRPSFPFYSFSTWYQRWDSAWVFTNPRDNTKFWDYSSDNSPYSGDNWYITYAGSHSSGTSDIQYGMNDDGGSTWQNPDANGHSSAYWESSTKNPCEGWVKIELEICFTGTAGAGFVNLWEDGVLKVYYVGRTDALAGTTRSEAIGGYNDSFSTHNWRYFQDLYYDRSRQRVMIGNASTWAACTSREVQPATAWATGEVSVTVNQAALSSLSTAYLYVFDSTGTPNSSGYALSGVSGGGGSPIVFGIRR